MSKWDDEYLIAERHAMVKFQLEARDITDERILEVMGTIPRHVFIPHDELDNAYKDGAVPIGHGQTISQPYMIALMLQAAHLWPHFKILEIGTGSGYNAAILSSLCHTVHTVEIIKPLAWQANAILNELGFVNVTVHEADGYDGLPKLAPFHAIFLTASPSHIPKPLYDQLALNGVLLAPIHIDGEQVLRRITRTETGFKEEDLLHVNFVPMTGKIEQERP